MIEQRACSSPHRFFTAHPSNFQFEHVKVDTLLTVLQHSQWCYTESTAERSTRSTVWKWLKLPIVSCTLGTHLFFPIAIRKKTRCVPEKKEKNRKMRKSHVDFFDSTWKIISSMGKREKGTKWMKNGEKNTKCPEKLKYYWFFSFACMNRFKSLKLIELLFMQWYWHWHWKVVRFSSYSKISRW